MGRGRDETTQGVLRTACQYLADVQVMEHRGLITERGSIRLK